MMRANISPAVLAAFLLFSCKGPEIKQNIHGSGLLSTQKLDTFKQARYPVTAAPYFFETAFFPGTRDHLYGKTVDFFAVNIGKINIESGKIVACDPAYMWDSHAFAVANVAFNALTSANSNLWQEVFVEGVDKFSRNTWDFTVYSFSGHNFASFSSGWGDGRYGSYIGYDHAEKICQLLTDFEIVDWNK